ncbi:MAG: 2,4-dihydroxyhept-2-ene-1,7-dioic acid aldolase [Rhizobiaceae bacterium MnEN-MB40S]|nr:MAG: 2,4-dihydroxyhept-2-ene-1,7-dioic acid aldolase [Rhizobiaceae bacterium MnEN-MB40S]
MPLADALRRGETNLTLWSFLHAQQPLELFARSSVDSIVLDAQHGAYGESDLVDSIGVCKAAEKPVLVRVPVDRPDLASRVLDFGADGVIAPMINSAAQASAFAGACKYPPLGERSWGPVRDLVLSQSPDPKSYFTSRNGQTLALAMVETREAVGNIDEILAVEGVDGIFVGPADLSISWTGGALMEPTTEELQNVIAMIAEKISAAGKIAGIYVTETKDIGFYHSLGYRLITCASDFVLLQAGVTSVMKAARDQVS